MDVNFQIPTSICVPSWLSPNVWNNLIWDPEFVYPVFIAEHGVLRKGSLLGFHS